MTLAGQVVVMVVMLRGWEEREGAGLRFSWSMKAVIASSVSLLLDGTELEGTKRERKVILATTPSTTPSRQGIDY